MPDRSTITRVRQYLVGNERQVPVPVAAAAVIEEGTLCCLNASGQLVPAARTAGFAYAGVALAAFDNTGGAAGSLATDASNSAQQRHAVVEAKLAWSFVVIDGGPDPAAGLPVYVQDATSVTTSSAAVAIAVGKLVRPDDATPGNWYVSQASSSFA